MNKTYLTVLFSMLAIGSYAQNATVTSGGDASGTGGTASYSVGQVTYVSSTGTNGAVSEGVQQAFEISIITGTEEIDINLSAYPNPTTDYLILEVEEANVSNLSYELTDHTGTLIKEDILSNRSTRITMENLLSGIYLLKVNGNAKIVKTFKIIKIK